MSEYTTNEILRAKRLAQQAGYDVTFPTNKIDVAKNIAKEAGYTVTKSRVQIPNRINPAVKPMKSAKPRSVEEIAAKYL